VNEVETLEYRVRQLLGLQSAQLADIERLKSLCSRAADALEPYAGPQGPDNQIDLEAMQMIVELRKAV